MAAADTVQALAGRGATVYSLDLLPRISRAQSMDALSSQATVSGYRAGLSAAEHLAKFFPMFMTAAGTVPPAKVLVMGAGVAGCRPSPPPAGSGAVVRAYDVRAAAKEEVQSLGAKFVELDLETQDGAGGYAKEQSAEYLAQQQELLAAEVAASDVVITTAQIPGRKAPVLVTDGHGGGDGRGLGHRRHGRRLGGQLRAVGARRGRPRSTGSPWSGSPTRRPPCPPTPASSTPGTSPTSWASLVKDGELAPDFDDEIVAGTCVVRAGTVVHGPTAEALGPSAPAPAPDTARRRRRGGTGATAEPSSRPDRGDGVMSTGILEFLTVFVLAAFVGIEVIKPVPSILHTPLMSGSNAIHGIVLVGTILIMGESHGAVQITLAFFAVLLATLNIVGGFVVTDRMLEMFKAKPSERAPKRRDGADDETSGGRQVTPRTPGSTWSTCWPPSASSWP